ncbi:MAG: hypothetical protein ACI80S_000563, partial [Pseudohongiellaceae bacterium]
DSSAPPNNIKFELHFDALKYNRGSVWLEQTI